MSRAERMSERSGLIATMVAFVALWLILDRMSAALGSLRGEWGVAVCAAVLAAAMLAEMTLSRCSAPHALSALGLTAPRAQSMLWSAAICAGLLAYFPVFALATGAQVHLRPDWALFVIGIFAQGGVAEELVFRGFLFRRFRQGRPFWRAALLSSIPFAAVHLLLFASMDFAVALAAFVMAVSISFPLAWIFERSGGTIWPAALLHAVIQGSIKLVEADDPFPMLAVGWIVFGSIAPWLVFLLKPEKNASLTPDRG